MKLLSYLLPFLVDHKQFIDIGISNNTMGILNLFVKDMLDHIQTEALFLCQMLGTNTMTAREIQP